MSTKSVIWMLLASFACGVFFSVGRHTRDKEIFRLHQTIEVRADSLEFQSGVGPPVQEGCSKANPNAMYFQLDEKNGNRLWVCQKLDWQTWIKVGE